MSDPQPTSPGTEETAEKLRIAILRLNRQLRHGAKPDAPVGPLQATILALVKLEPGLGVTELAAREGMTVPSMSLHVKRLEAAGYLKRSAAKEDRRRAGLHLTEEGRTLIEALKRQRTGWLAQRLEALSPAQRRKIADALDALSELAEPRP